MDKRATRQHLMRQRAALPSQARLEASQAICRHLISSPVWPAQTLGLFCALPEEADPSALQAATVGRVAYPQVAGDDLIFRAAPPEQLRPVPPFGVKEPQAHHPPVRAFDLIVVPGLGFTREGRRIGYGRGFYDRFLRQARLDNPRVLTVGFGFVSQVVEALPWDPWDEPLDALVTDQGFLWAAPSSTPQENR